MASQAARFLIQADLLPSLAAPLWDTSSVISQSSVAGVLLRGFIGYDARPAGMQIVFYLIALATIGLGMGYISRSQRLARAARTHA
jgi:high-affinity iron transporter